MARKILLADDSVTAQNMGRKILTDAGYEVVTVNNGSAALKRVTEQKPELIVLDVYMPGYSGLEVCQRLKDSRETSRIPILLTVGKLEPFKPEDARRVGADAFIVKPFEASELLSALTRLEDRIVPQGDASRFAATVSGIERFAGDPAVKRQESADGGEQGWKSRIRFPSKKSKKEEPEPEPDYVAPPTFRELREPSTKKTKSAAPAETHAERQEPGLVPDIPHDITPDELDALSALVAKLDGPIPQAEEIAPIGDAIGFSGTEAAEAAAASKTEEAAPTVEAGAPKEEVERPAEIASEAKEEVITTAPPEEEATAVKPATPEIKTTPSIDDYTTAPVDREDEPFFATVASAVPQSGTEEETSARNESSNAEPATAEVSAPAAKEQPPTVEAGTTGKEQSRVEEIVAEAVAEEVVAGPPASGEDRAPSEEELAEALKLLTPVHDMAFGQVQAAASQQESASAPQGSMEAEAAQLHAGNGSRWVAEAVQLTPEEMALSLEAEMFRILAPAAVPITAAASEPFAAASSAVDQAGTTSMEAESPRQSTQEEVDASVAASSVVIQDSDRAGTTDQTARSEGTEQPAQEPVSAALPPSSTPESGDSTGSQASIDAIVLEHVDATIAALSTTQEATGDQEDMSKKAKTDQGKGSRSGWHQIHAAAAATADVDAAKHSEGEAAAEERPKAMAAAANGDDGTSAGAPDPNAIASIVDSVLADLRPRIVEEIAKKLGKKK